MSTVNAIAVPKVVISFIKNFCKFKTVLERYMEIEENVRPLSEMISSVVNCRLILSARGRAGDGEAETTIDNSSPWQRGVLSPTNSTFVSGINQNQPIHISTDLLKAISVNLVM